MKPIINQPKTNLDSKYYFLLSFSYAVVFDKKVENIFTHWHFETTVNYLFFFYNNNIHPIYEIIFIKEKEKNKCVHIPKQRNNFWEKIVHSVGDVICKLLVTFNAT